jgi:hypothetical protein
MIKNFLEKHPVKSQRALEIGVGAITWAVITSPLWASFWLPTLMAYFILLMTVYWVYKSGGAAFFLILGYKKMQKHRKIDWLKRARNLKNFENVHHIIIIPNYKETLEKLIPTLEAITSQTLSSKKITVVLALEKREGQEAVARAEALKNLYQEKLANFYYTIHPDIIGEVKGKSSNEAWAGKWIKKKIVDEEGYDIDFLTITSCDADAVFDHQYFANLTYYFLKNPNRYRTFWQGAILEYSNIWRVHAPIRMVSAVSSAFKIGHLMRPYEVTPYSTYSASLKMVDKVGYWDTDVIPEDWRMFFKSFFALGGKVEVESIHLPIYIDAVEGKNFLQEMKKRYDQNRRHAWGVTDIPYIVKQWFAHPEIPFLAKTYRALKAYESHFMWPTNWFILTLGVNLSPLINPDFTRTILGYTTPGLARMTLTICLVFSLIFIIVDWKIRPPRPAYFKRLAFITSYAQWIIMPIVSLFVSALPGLDAHTRLMIGKGLEYKVVEKF